MSVHGAAESAPGALGEGVLGNDNDIQNAGYAGGRARLAIWVLARRHRLDPDKARGLLLLAGMIRMSVLVVSLVVPTVALSAASHAGRPPSTRLSSILRGGGSRSPLPRELRRTEIGGPVPTAHAGSGGVLPIRARYRNGRILTERNKKLPPGAMRHVSANGTELEVLAQPDLTQYTIRHPLRRRC